MYVFKTSPFSSSPFPSPPHSPPSSSHAFVLFSKHVFNFCNLEGSIYQILFISQGLGVYLD